MLLVKFRDNYADEFNVNGFTFLKNKEEFELLLVQTWLESSWEGNLKDLWSSSFEVLKEVLDEEANYEQEFYFGSNQELIFENFEDFCSSFTTKEVSDEEYNLLVSLFGTKYGYLPLVC